MATAHPLVQIQVAHFARPTDIHQRSSEWAGTLDSGKVADRRQHLSVCALRPHTRVHACYWLAPLLDL